VYVRRFALLLALVAVALTGCGGPPKLDNGYVYKKTYEPARSYVAFIPLIISCGQSCTSVIMVPYSFYDDPDYILWLKNCEPQPASRENGVIIHHRGCRQGVAYVDPIGYNEAKIGQWFDVHGVQPPRTATVNDHDKKKGKA
jgi:hypothetical protein